MKYEIKRMTRGDLDTAVQWAADEGWNPGLGDAEIFYRTDPSGYFKAERNGEMIGAVSCVSYGDDFGFIGFFIVKPGWRGGLVGIKLGKAAMDYLGRRNIGVDGVEDKVKKYSHYGFRLAYHNYRYAGRVVHSEKTSPSVSEYAPADRAGVAEYDRRCFPAARDEFLDGWLTARDSTTLLHCGGGRLSGFGTIRKCRNGYKIGPLFADDADVAGELLAALQNAAADGEEFFWDIPGPNEPAIAMAKKMGMKPVFGTARMYSRGEPAVELDKIFGVTTFELG